MTNEEFQATVIRFMTSISNSQESANLRLISIENRLGNIENRLSNIEERLRKIERFVATDNADFSIKIPA